MSDGVDGVVLNWAEVFILRLCGMRWDKKENFENLLILHEEEQKKKNTKI
jgi:hypothetical protein